MFLQSSYITVLEPTYYFYKSHFMIWKKLSAFRLKLFFQVMFRKSYYFLSSNALVLQCISMKISRISDEFLASFKKANR